MTAAQRRRLQHGGITLLLLPLLAFALFPLLWILDSSFKSLAETHTSPRASCPISGLSNRTRACWASTIFSST
jgi:ABC-type glycerol-3-phosphate transport system permease component